MEPIPQEMIRAVGMSQPAERLEVEVGADRLLRGPFTIVRYWMVTAWRSLRPA